MLAGLKLYPTLAPSSQAMLVANPPIDTYSPLRLEPRPYPDPIFILFFYPESDIPRCRIQG